MRRPKAGGLCHWVNCRTVHFQKAVKEAKCHQSNITSTSCNRPETLFNTIQFVIDAACNVLKNMSESTCGTFLHSSVLSGRTPTLTLLLSLLCLKCLCHSSLRRCRGCHPPTAPFDTGALTLSGHMSSLSHLPQFGDCSDCLQTRGGQTAFKENLTSILTLYL